MHWSKKTVGAVFCLTAGCGALALAPGTASAQHRRRRHHSSSSSPSRGTESGSYGGSGSESYAPAASTSYGDETRASSSVPAGTEVLSDADRRATQSDAVSDGEGVLPAEESEPRPVAASPPPSSPAVDVSVGSHVFARHLSYNDDVEGRFHAYNLDVAPAVAGTLEWYPGAHFTRDAGAHVGLIAAGEYMVGVASTDADGRRYETSAYGYSAGLRVRFPFDASELGLFAAYGAEGFAIQGSASANDPGVPSVEYQFVRAGSDVRLGVHPHVALVARAAYRYVAGVNGAYTTQFPELSVGGFEGALGVAFPLAAGVELRAVGDVRHFFYAMNPGPTAPQVGGAIDLYYGGTLSLALRR